MAVQNVSGQGLRYPLPSAAVRAEEQTSAAQKAEQAAEEPAKQTNRDRFEKGLPSKPVTYSKNQLTGAQVKQLQDDQEQRMRSFQTMLQGMVAKQGQYSNLTLFGMRLNVTPEDSRKAASAIADGGEYSVDAVAGRLIDMAKALSGGDASKISELRAAVGKGFKAAGVDFGGKLPGICQDTYTEVMKRFDDWEQEARGSQTAADA